MQGAAQTQRTVGRMEEGDGQESAERRSTWTTDRLGFPPALLLPEPGLKPSRPPG